MKKIVVLSWRDPNGSLQIEEFDAEEFKVHTEPGCLKLHSKAHGGIARILPWQRVELVQFGEKKEESQIVVPHVVPDLPNKFEAS